MTQAEAREPGKLVVGALLVAVSAIATAAVAIRLAAPLDAVVVAAARVSVTGLALWMVARTPTVEAWRVLAGARREAGLCVLAGVCLALHFGAWITSLGLTTVVRSVALVATQPLFAALFARALGDRASPRLYLGTLIAVAGTLVMVEPGAGSQVDQSASWIGDGLALLGAVMAAIYLVIGRSVHRSLGAALPLGGYLVLVNLSAATCLWLFVLISGVELWPSGADWSDVLAIAWLGLVPGVIGHGALNWAVRRVPVHVVALAVLLEPLGAALIALLVLAEVPSGRELVGALALLAGVALGLPRLSARAERPGPVESQPPA